ncbi:Hypp8909 [Branchiostoma lanceolatum]|uniref:Hypp8909 protein n=1 Tax=Branchiostoma lanceolatum TaxID=7740 RepID=A0A8J9ZC19_BRALA|nr:Hypp8909 [Branchiostoma lanceolatum]
MFVSTSTARNLAEHKHARQYRTKYRSEAGLAVDGNVHPDYHQGSCSYTNAGPDVWWYVDLEESYAIGEVKVYNNDRYPEMINPFNIMVGNSSDVGEMSQCGGNFGADYEDTLTWVVDCGGATGRYVMVLLPGPNRSLMMCEVRVYEYTGPD